MSKLHLKKCRSVNWSRGQFLFPAEGNTVTHLAAAFGKGECFNCCLQHGGSLQLKNNRDETAFDCAKRKGHPVSIQKALTNKVS